MTDWEEFRLQVQEAAKPVGPSKRAQDWNRLAAGRLAKMHQRYGRGPEGVTCKDCVFLERHRPGRTSFLKCRRAGVSASNATDWRAKWSACGAYEVEK